MGVDEVNVEISDLVYVDITDREQVLGDPLMVDQASADPVDCLGKEESKLFEVSDVHIYVELPYLGQPLFPGSQVSEVPKYICSVNIDCDWSSSNNNVDRSTGTRPLIIMRS